MTTVPPHRAAAHEPVALSAAELSRIAADVLAATPLPALVLAVPSERIVAASRAATRLVNPGDDMIVGHLLEEFTADRPAIGDNLFAGGRLNGFETFRVLRRSTGEDLKVRMWIRSFDGQPASEFVLVVLGAEGPPAEGAPDTDWQEATAVVGTANARLLIERISSDAEELFQQPVEEMVGRSLIALVAEEDVPNCMAAVDEASSTQTGVTLHLALRAGGDAQAVRCEVLILPLQPSPSCAFVFLPIQQGEADNPVAADLASSLIRLGRGAEVAQLARGVFGGLSESTVPGVSRLTTRELEIVNHLVEGDRAPAIARKLFLSQSTVRNHLASVFGKLGVASQQELLDLFRAA